MKLNTKICIFKKYYRVYLSVYLSFYSNSKKYLKIHLTKNIVN